jgi:hypothetical protein
LLHTTLEGRHLLCRDCILLHVYRLTVCKRDIIASSRAARLHRKRLEVAIDCLAGQITLQDVKTRIANSPNAGQINVRQQDQKQYGAHYDLDNESACFFDGAHAAQTEKGPRGRSSVTIQSIDSKALIPWAVQRPCQLRLWLKACTLLI